LTSEEFTERFGPTQKDYQAVINFLQTNGFQVTATHPNRLLVDVSGSVADVQRTFGVSLRVYRHPTENRTFYSPDAEPSVPSGIPILDVSGLENFMPPRPIDLRRKEGESKIQNPQSLLTPTATEYDDESIVAYATGSGP